MPEIRDQQIESKGGSSGRSAIGSDDIVGLLSKENVDRKELAIVVVMLLPHIHELTMEVKLSSMTMISVSCGNISACDPHCESHIRFFRKVQH